MSADWERDPVEVAFRDEGSIIELYVAAIPKAIVLGVFAERFRLYEIDEAIILNLISQHNLVPTQFA